MTHKLVREDAGYAFDREGEGSMLKRRSMSELDDLSEQALDLFVGHFFSEFFRADRRVAKSCRHRNDALWVRCMLHQLYFHISRPRFLISLLREWCGRTFPPSR